MKKAVETVLWSKAFLNFWKMAQNSKLNSKVKNSVLSGRFGDLYGGQGELCSTRTIRESWQWFLLSPSGADLGGGCRGCAPPPDDLRFSNTTGILQKQKTMWFIGVEVEQETSAPPPKKNPGSAPVLCNNISLLAEVSHGMKKNCTACTVPASTGVSFRTSKVLITCDTT